ncbi:hypothetical protein [Methylocystis sp.]|uniref:hypothetical protein n=1 Tax=Methylocystis sp. TaxID=1911079 RepID=UPI0025D060A1|nr:hypothetical protein [Methylocystis sp.]
MKKAARSRVTNARLKGGRVTVGSLFIAADGRSPWARRYRDMVAMLVGDAGGLESLTELRLSLIRRCAALIVECEKMEVTLADGGKVDIDLLARTSSHVRRISETIGLDRATRDVTPSLAQIVAQHRQDAAGKSEATPAPSHLFARTQPCPQPPQPSDDAIVEEEAAE